MQASKKKVQASKKGYRQAEMLPASEMLQASKKGYRKAKNVASKSKSRRKAKQRMQIKQDNASKQQIYSGKHKNLHECKTPKLVNKKLRISQKIM